MNLGKFLAPRFKKRQNLKTDSAEHPFVTEMQNFGQFFNLSSLVRAIAEIIRV